jgi:hypothetical protein
MNLRKLFTGLILTTATLFFIGCGEAPQQDRSGTEKTELRRILEALPDCQVEEIEADPDFSECYRIVLKQPIDHNHPEAGYFGQHILIFHKDFNRPVVMTTEGYALRQNMTRELSELVDGNEIRVEHRYFGDSVPDPKDWKYLHLKQAAADHHRIVGLLKPNYPGKWLNTGLSKGGKVAMIHRWLYPEDVDVTVSYDGPLNLALEDYRFDAFLERIGTEAQRAQLIAFQRMVLSRKKEILPLFKTYAGEKGLTYPIGLERGLEYLVLEYTFSFWQNGRSTFSEIPGEEASPEIILAHLLKTVPATAYSGRAMDSPALYQAVTQYGYYGYVTKNVSDLLSGTGYTNAEFAPRNTDLTYDPVIMQEMSDWIEYHGNQMIFIHGGNDPWSAGAVTLSGKTDALKMILEGGSHLTFIRSFSSGEREMILAALERWLGIEIERKELKEDK